MSGVDIMKAMTVAFGLALALASWNARAAESKVAKKFDAGPAIQGNSDPVLALHKKKAKAPAAHRKAM